jgi:hypothetical protein
LIKRRKMFSPMSTELLEEMPKERLEQVKPAKAPKYVHPETEKEVFPSKNYAKLVWPYGLKPF